MGFGADSYKHAFSLPTNEHCGRSPLAPNRAELCQADAMPAEEALCQLLAPYLVPSPSCSLTQGHSGSIMERLREEFALSHQVLWDKGCVLAPQSGIYGKRGLPSECCSQTS